MYDLILISLPMLMSGAIFGVMLNQFFPSTFISLVKLIVIIDSSIKTYNKLMVMVEKLFICLKKRD